MSFFLKLLLGVLFIPVFNAIIQTSFYTVLGIIPFFYLFLLILHRKKLKLKIHFESKLFLLHIVILFFFIFIQLLRDDYFNASLDYLYQVDAGISTTRATYLSITGIEVFSPWYQLFDVSADHLAKPYHYGDLWFLAFSLKNSALSSLNTLIYIVIPIFATIITAGGLMLWHLLMPTDCGKINPIAITTAIGATLFYTGIPGVEWSLLQWGNVLMDFRIAPFHIFLLGSFLFYYLKKEYVSVIITGIIPIFNIIYAPVVFTAWGSWYLFHFMKMPRERKIYFIKIFILIFIALYILLFYKIFGTWQPSSLMTQSLSGGYWYWLLKNFVAIVVKFLIFNNPIIILGIITWTYRAHIEPQRKALVIISLLILIMAALTTSIINYNVESAQFTGLIYRPISGVLFLLMVAILYDTKKNRAFLYCFSIILTVYSLVITIYFVPQRESVVSKHFLEEVASNLQNVNPIGASIANKKQEDTYTAQPHVCLFCNFLKDLKAHHFWVNSLTVPADANDTAYPERKTTIELAPFYQFIQVLKKQGIYKGYENAQIQFINKYHIDFIIVEKGAAVPTLIQQCVRTEIIDAVSGNRVLCLQPSCNNALY